MFFRKNRQIVFFLFVFCGLSAQIEEKEPRSFLFGLIKLDKQSKYEDGYWINKWFFSREFFTPVNIMPVEVRYGFGATGKRKGSWAKLSRYSLTDEPKNISYESDNETSVIPIPIGNNNIWDTSLEIDLGLINFPHYIVGPS